MVVVSCDNNASVQIYTPVESENIDNCNPNAKPTTGGVCCHCRAEEDDEINT